METIDNFVGLPDDWAKYVTNVEMVETPFLDWLLVGNKPVNPIFSYQAEKFRAPRRNSHVDGKPFSEPFSAGDSRAPLKATIQWFDHGVSVSKLSQDVTANPAIIDELAHEIPKAMKELARDMEANFLEDNDCREDNKVVGYLSRAVGSWVSASAQALYPVDANFRPPAAQNVTTAWATDMTENIIRGVLESIWLESKGTEMITAFAGKDGIRGVTDLSWRIPTSTAGSPTVNAAVKISYKDGTITRSAHKYEGDFNSVMYMPDPYILNLDPSYTATKKNGRVYYLHQSKWELRWNQKPTVYKQEFKGGSYEAFMDALAMLVCRNPRGEAMQNPA